MNTFRNIRLEANLANEAAESELPDDTETVVREALEKLMAVLNRQGYNVSVRTNDVSTTPAEPQPSE